MRCPRCSGVLYIDDGDRACMFCGWRDYAANAQRVLAEEALLSDDDREAVITGRRRRRRSPSV